MYYVMHAHIKNKYGESPHTLTFYQKSSKNNFKMSGLNKSNYKATQANLPH